MFAAALEGNKRAELVGEHTLGRAGMQKLVQLPENRGLWLTYARYLTPSGESIQGKGLKPDVEVEDTDVTDFGTPASDRPIRSWTRRSARARRPRLDCTLPDNAAVLTVLDVLHYSFGKASVFKT